MITEEAARRQLEILHKEGSTLAEEFNAEQERLRKLYPKRVPKKAPGVLVVRLGLEKEKNEKEEEQVPEPPPVDETHFEERYQSWYSRTLPLMKQLGPDRYTEFQQFYSRDKSSSAQWSRSSVIQDYLLGVEDGLEDSQAAAIRCFRSQLAILKSVAERLKWQTPSTEAQLERAMQLDMLESARGLSEVDERAAGVLVGTVLDAWLRRFAAQHQVKLSKQTPSTRDYAEALKNAKVLDLSVASQLTWLAEIHARARAKGDAPTKMQVRDIIDGTRWLLTNIF